ncbi:MAG: protein kinase, partial [Planctomycetes bacterium]|nr:protein kinase [Planctomycetota bacterium]
MDAQKPARETEARRPATSLAATRADDDPRQGSTLARTVSDGVSGADAKAVAGLAQPATLSGSGDRYRVLGELGAGANGRVFAAEDRDLGRTVAVKVLQGHEVEGRRDRFLNEARVTASLEHPGVVPVYDVGRTAAGAPYFTMKRVGGVSLGAALASTGAAPAAIVDLNARVTVLLKICDALAAAHSRGVLHCDIKPDNVMVGEFGEVLVVDWGIAASVADAGSSPGGRSGTPLYMSPEQARGEPLSVASDIYALGATMFVLLVGRPPTRAADEAGFWEKKRSGRIDPLSAEERARVPGQLLAIAHQALAPRAGDRYASVSAFAEDLRRWQSGLAVSVYHDPLGERLHRWWRLHRRALLASIAVCSCVVALVVFLYRERLKEIAAWGPPTIVESFADDAWQQRWTVLGGSFEARDGALVGTGPAASVLLYRARLSGAAAIEFTGTILPGSIPCDLSVIFLPEARWSPDGGLAARGPTWELKAGAFDNSCCAIISPDQRRVAIKYRRLEPGRAHRIRAEVEGERLALFVDGELVCEHREPFPFTGGHFALLGYFPGKAFADARITSKGMPERVPATAYGDAFAERGDWAAAIEQYARVIAAHGGSDLADEARYRMGLCQLRSGDHAVAEATWTALRGGPFEVRTRALMIDARFAVDPVSTVSPQFRGEIAQPYGIAAPEAATAEVAELA